MKLSVVLPVYNERETLLEILERVRAVELDKEIIIVDNCSTDGTREIVSALQWPDVRVILQPENRQKGNSVRRGFEAAQGEYVVIQDGDLEYDPQDYHALLRAVDDDGALAALGSRVLGARQRGEKLPFTLFALGRSILNLLFRVLYGSRLTDIATCYKFMPAALARDLKLRCNGFDLDFEIVSKLALRSRREGKPIADVPVAYHPRTVAQGKKIAWRDFFTALWAILSSRFARV